MAALGDQLRKDGVDWEEFFKLYNAIVKPVTTYIRGNIVEKMDGGIMWGASGPEGKDEGRDPETPSVLKKTGQASAVAGGFAALGDDEESEEEEEEDEDTPAPVPVSAPAAATGGKGKKDKKEEELDPELAKLMAEMEVG